MKASKGHLRLGPPTYLMNSLRGVLLEERTISLSLRSGLLFQCKGEGGGVPGGGPHLSTQGSSCIVRKTHRGREEKGEIQVRYASTLCVLLSHVFS